MTRKKHEFDSKQFVWQTNGQGKPDKATEVKKKAHKTFSSYKNAMQAKVELKVRLMKIGKTMQCM